MGSPWPGFATPVETQDFQANAEGKAQVAQGHFRTIAEGLVLTSLGMGTYLGDPNTQTDAEVAQAAYTSVASGAVNVLDTAINYRYQSAERSLGQALSRLIEAGVATREQVFISSKNGYLTPDAAVRQDFRSYFEEHFIRPGIIKPEDIAGGMHCMSPGYLADQLQRSLANLGVETLDLMYLHNAAESQLGLIGREAFMARLEAAFTFYEEARQKSQIRTYGLATWDCFRVPQEQKGQFLNLEDVVQLACRVGGEAHGFRFIQLPYNLAMPEALVLKNQTAGGQRMSTLEACQALGIGVFTSVPLLQGQLLQQQGLPQFEGLQTPAQACLQFVRSTPGIIAPLVGHKQSRHVQDNLAVAMVPPLTREQFEALFLAQTGR